MRGTAPVVNTDAAMATLAHVFAMPVILAGSAISVVRSVLEIS